MGVCLFIFPGFVVWVFRLPFLFLCGCCCLFFVFLFVLWVSRFCVCLIGVAVAFTPPLVGVCVCFGVAFLWVFLLCSLCVCLLCSFCGCCVVAFVCFGFVGVSFVCLLVVSVLLLLLFILLCLFVCPCLSSLFCC